MSDVQFVPVQYNRVVLGGGMDQITPTLSLAPGVTRRSTNFEASITGGYSRIAGYERFDGHARPSDANYLALTCALTASVAVGVTVTGVTSGATAKTIYVSGALVVVTRVTGTFTAGESLTVSASSVGTLTSYISIVVDPAADANYRFLAANEYRTSISVVPGQGSILGVAFYAGSVYAWRAAVGGATVNMYQSTSSGWSQIVFGEEVKFTNANANVVDGVVLTQGGVTATVKRVVVQTGSLASGTNTGRLIITGRSGGNFSAAAATTSGGGTLTLAAAQTAITLLPGGNFQGVVANFGGGTKYKRLYVADGVNRAFEWDGTVMVPITTGMANDAPSQIVAHKQHLFLSFDYSLQFSATGNPYSWSVVLGAGEIAMSNPITDLIILPGNQATGALAIYSRTDTYILYGSDQTTFSLVPFNTGAGAIANSAQNLDQTYIVNDQGVVGFNTSLQFGNFEPSTLTNHIANFMAQHVPNLTASGLSRKRGQYRVFFSDGYGLYVTIHNGQFVGAMPVQFPDPVLCMCEGQHADGSSTSYFGSTSGYVFEIDAGTSFDGANIAGGFTLVFNGIGNARMLKRYRKASVELKGSSYATLSFGYDLGYRSQYKDQAADQQTANDLRSSWWDEMGWDTFNWDGQELSPSELGVTGSAENIAFRVGSDSAQLQPFTVNSITVHYSTRRGIR